MIEVILFTLAAACFVYSMIGLYFGTCPLCNRMLTTAYNPAWGEEAPYPYCKHCQQYLENMTPKTDDIDWGPIPMPLVSLVVSVVSVVGALILVL